jgi:hypothetical protein
MLWNRSGSFEILHGLGGAGRGTAVLGQHRRVSCVWGDRLGILDASWTRLSEAVLQSETSASVVRIAGLVVDCLVLKGQRLTQPTRPTCGRSTLYPSSLLRADRPAFGASSSQVRVGLKANHQWTVCLLNLLVRKHLHKHIPSMSHSTATVTSPARNLS